MYSSVEAAGLKPNASSPKPVLQRAPEMGHDWSDPKRVGVIQQKRKGITSLNNFERHWIKNVKEISLI